MNPPPQGPPPLQYGQYSLPPQIDRARFGRGLLGWLLFIALAAVLFVVLAGNRSNPAQTEIPLSEFYRLLRDERVEQVTIGDTEVRGKLTGEVHVSTAVGAKKVLHFRATLPQGMGTNWAFTQWVLENARSTRVDVDNGGSLLMNIVVPLIPWVLIFGFIWFFVFRQLRAQGRPQQPWPVMVVNPGAPGTVPPGSMPPPTPPQPPGA